MFFCTRSELFCFVFVTIFALFLQPAESIKWLALRSGVPRGGQGRCALARALGVQPCAALAPLSLAARLTTESCRQLCSHRRWNCSSLELAPNYTPDLLLGTKEQSFVYALSAAALMHTMSRACSSGLLSSCTCGQPPRQRPGRGFKWGGCSDNLKWAGRFVKQFTEDSSKDDFFAKTDKDQKEIRIFDTADRQIDQNGNLIKPISTTQDYPTNNSETTRLVLSRKDPETTENSAEESTEELLTTLVSEDAEVKELNAVTENVATLVRRDAKRKKKGQQRGGSRQRKAYNTKETLEEKLERLQPYIALANLQNSKVGRKIAERSPRIECKCHGVSGSCSVRTCWRALPPLGTLGAALLARSAGASRVRAPRPPRHYGGAGPYRQAAQGLVFVSPSPDYCRRDPAMGSLGTSGRWCNGSLAHGESSCRALCCGRGHRTLEVSRLERCHCRYIWCCRVECQVCKISSLNHYCN